MVLNKSEWNKNIDDFMLIFDIENDIDGEQKRLEHKERVMLNPPKRNVVCNKCNEMFSKRGLIIHERKSACARRACTENH